MFKSSERKPNNRNSDRHYSSNSFRSTTGPPVQKFEIKEEDFPELRVEGQAQSKKENVLQYKNAMLKSDEVEEAPTYDLKPGWTRIYYDANRKVVMEKYYDQNDYEEDYHECAQRGIQTLVDKWENDRIAYNNLYGEGEYERIYYMPRREEDNYYDDDSEDEVASVEDEQQYYDEDSQYYDLY
jgi:hypothetical protein